MTAARLTRRGFLVAGAAAGGGLVVGCAQGETVSPLAAGAKPGEAALNAWLKIAEDGTVTVAAPRQEMGQGVYTGLAQLVADELDADWSRVRVEQAPVDKVYANTALLLNALPFEAEDDGLAASASRWAVRQVAELLGVQATGGSTSLRDAWVPMRQAGAAAREMLIAAAAARWGVAAGECTTRDGQVRHAGSDRALGYGALAAAAARQTPPERPRLKQPGELRLIGVDRPRLDVPAKVDGSARYGIDVRPEGLVYAAIAMPPTAGGRVISYDGAAAKRQRGVVAVVPVEGAVAVVAAHYWQARKGLQALNAAFEGEHPGLGDATIAGWLEAGLDSGDARSYREEGDVAAVLAGAAKVVEATYQAPFLAHACMEPMNCTARVADGRCEIWTGNQAPTLVAFEAAELLGLSMRDVTVHTPYLGGGFGRRAEVDAVRQSVLIAKALPGRPVQLIWSREDDIRHDMYRPAAMARFRAGLDAGGRLLAWQARHASPSASNAYTARILPWAAMDGPDKTNAEGSADLPYGIPDIAVTHALVKTPIPVGFWRSVGHSQNAFFTECFLDEVAAAAGADPFAFRLALLAGKPRFAKVLRLAAEKAGWGSALPAGRGRGIALHRSFGSIAAQVAEVTVADGAVRVDRVVCAIDCGTVVSPDIVAAQMESGIVYGLSAALHGEIGIQDGAVVQGNFPDYEMVRMANAPRIEVHIVADGHPPGGVGEPGTPPVAPAVANAIFAATGTRLRRLPLARAGFAAA
jgi:isoquinoline 1-oxidoreductase beta subunit